MRKGRLSRQAVHWQLCLVPRLAALPEISVWSRTRPLSMSFGGESECLLHLLLFIAFLIPFIFNKFGINSLAFWWFRGSPNIEMDEHTFLVNRERAVDYLNSLDKVILLIFFLIYYIIYLKVNLFFFPLFQKEKDIGLLKYRFKVSQQCRISFYNWYKSIWHCCKILNLCFKKYLAPTLEKDSTQPYIYRKFSMTVLAFV